jgi:hypothetical protein
MSIRDSVKQFLKMCGHAMVSTVHERLDVLEGRMADTDRQTADTHAALLQASIHTAEILRQTAKFTVVEAGDDACGTAEDGLIRFLYSLLPSGAALQISNGKSIDCLERAGYRAENFDSSSNSPGVRVRELQDRGLIPVDFDLVMIRISGLGLELLRVMDGERYRVVMVEYQSSEAPGALETFIKEMRDRRYMWHVVLYRVPGGDEVFSYSCRAASVPNSWGSVFFFSDYEVFSQAQQWCSAVLKRTYFRPGRLG